MLSMSRDGTIDRSMETKSEEILSAGTNGPVSHLSATDTCPLPPLPLHPLNDRQLKDAWVTPDLERPRPFPNPADDPRLHAIHDRKPRLRLSVARSGTLAGATEPRGGDSIFSIVGLSRQISISTRFCGLLVVMRFLNEGVLFFFPPSLLKTFPFPKLNSKGIRVDRKKGLVGIDGNRDIFQPIERFFGIEVSGLVDELVWGIGRGRRRKRDRKG